MSSQRWIQWPLIVIAIAAGLALFAYLLNPFLPTTIVYRSENPVVQTKFEDVLRKNGVSFGYDTDVHGERVVIINNIAPRDFEQKTREFKEWQESYYRKQEVIIN